MERAVVEVAVNVPLTRLFHYEVPQELEGKLELGHRVLVPFGRQVTTGICVGFPRSAGVSELKAIRRVLHPDCRFDSHLLELTRWVADYYRAGWGEVLEAALPPPIRSGREERRVLLVSAGKAAEEMLAESLRLVAKAPAQSRLLAFLASNRGPLPQSELLRAAASNSDALRKLHAKGWATTESARGGGPPGAEASNDDLAALRGAVEVELSGGQAQALEAVRTATAAGRFRAILLHGITGSGKTEVYLRALREVLAAGKRGLVLVPEISLTPQTVLRFREGLRGEPVAVLHSMLGAAERTRQWRQIQEGKAKLVIGVRSSIFAPVPDLGLIVTDEEHDGSYKQESTPRYNARDLAVVRARLLGIPVLLGSATPSLESYQNARQGKYDLVEMPRRATSHDLPSIAVVPLDGSFYRPDGSGLITDQLDVLVRSRLRRGEQVLLFLNRRGFATFIHCTRCGYVLKCPECDITLTFHKSQSALRCHYCGHSRDVPADCPDCLLPGLRRSGVGTEKITEELARRYPGARVARLDRDTATTHAAMRATIGSFARGDHDILVGTQMVAKGHDFPSVTLVGVINADTGLQFPDFRAAERTFQLLTQVAGRAGRGARAGQVVLQTFFPEHYAIRAAAEGDFHGFARKELEFRRAFGYPPFGRLVKLLFQGSSEEDVAREAKHALEVLREASSGVRILGPAPSPIARIQGRHRQQILLKSASSAALRRAVERLEERCPQRKGGVDRIVDVDPQSML